MSHETKRLRKAAIIDKVERLRMARELRNPMSWNYRVVSREYPEEPDNELLEIHEAYYKSDKKQVRSITVDPQYGPYETLEELEFNLTKMLDAVKAAKRNKKLILQYKDYNENQ